MVKIKTVILIISLALNALFAMLAAGALRSKPAVQTLSFFQMEGSIVAAMVVSVPLETGGIVFNPAEIVLRKGESATLQISSVSGGMQANWIIQALYDRSVVSVSPNATGITITAIEIGECPLQTLASEGITDVALIKVVE